MFGCLVQEGRPVVVVQIRQVDESHPRGLEESEEGTGRRRGWCGHDVAVQQRAVGRVEECTGICPRWHQLRCHVEEKNTHHR